MARAYGVDLRKRVIEAIEAGLSTRAAARRFAIGFSTAGSWHRDWCRKGTFEPDRQGQPEGSKLDAHEAFILALIDTDEKDISLAEIAERLEADKGVSACQSLISRFFKKRGITWKKRLRTPRSSSATTSWPRAEPGSRRSSISIRGSWSSSTKAA
tara:strand:- start:546 stop:1013 length:468 start_codon:yes stop_codon:yes gene_type:complete